MSEQQETFSAATSRRSVLAGMIGAGIASSSSPVSAGFEGMTLGMTAVQPKDAEIDDDLLRTSSVQKGVRNIKQYRVVGNALKAAFDKNNDMPLIPIIRKEFDLAKIRDDLNNIVTIFDEDTQTTIDRLARAILNDIIELENVSRFKKGTNEVRTPKKVEAVTKWFNKLDTDFVSVISFLPEPKPTPAPAPAPDAEPA